MQATGLFASNLSANICSMLAIQALSQLFSKRPNFFFADFQRVFHKSLFVKNFCFILLQQWLITLFYKSNLIAMQLQKNYLVDTPKTCASSFCNGGVFKTQSNFNGTCLRLKDLLEKYRENNFAKLNCLRLQTQENFLEWFHQLTKTSKKISRNMEIHSMVETTWIFRPEK